MSSWELYFWVLCSLKKLFHKIINENDYHFWKRIYLENQIIKSKKNVFVNTTQVKLKLNTGTVIEYLIDA